MTTNNATNNYILTATKAQQVAGTVTNVAVTPAVQQNHLSASKAWVNFVGSTGTIANGFNTASVVRNSAGNYTVNWIVPFLDGGYSFAINCYSSSATGYVGVAIALTTTTFNFITFESSTGNIADPTNVSVICFGTQ